MSFLSSVLPKWVAHVPEINLYNPDALTLFVFIIIFFVVFTIFECRGLLREMREHRVASEQKENKAE